MDWALLIGIFIVIILLFMSIDGMNDDFWK